MIEEATVVKKLKSHLIRQGYQELPTGRWKRTPDLLMERKGVRVAIEAKGSRADEIPKAIGQAVHYVPFVHKTYIAIPDDILHDIDLSIIENLGIGLFVISKSKVDEVLKPKLNEKPRIPSRKRRKERKTVTISRELMDKISEFRWRNRFESYSQSVEFILKQGLSMLSAKNFYLERGDVAEERKLNNQFYRKVKPKLLEEHMNEYVVIARGRLLGFAQRFEEALEILSAHTHAEKVNHAIIDKIGEEVRVSEVWEGFVEKIK